MAEDAAVAGPSAELVNKMPFPMFVKRLEKLADPTAHGFMNLRSRKINIFRQAVIFDKINDIRKGHHSTFPYFRLLLPHLDTERGAYNLKEAKIADSLISALGIGPGDAMRLKHYKDPNSGKGRALKSAATGDFAGVAYEVIKHRCPRKAPSTWDLGAVNNWLDRLASPTLTPPEREELFKELVEQLPATEIKWVLRIILKDLKVGVKQDSVFKWYHNNAKECYSATLNLRSVFEDESLMDEAKDKKFSISLGFPFSPMNAARMLLPTDGEPPKRDDFVQGRKPLITEQKLDGERMVMHFNRLAPDPKDRLKIFSRKSLANDLYAQLMYPYVEKSLHKACTEAIIDGEMLAYDEDVGRLLKFGNNRTVEHEMQADPKSRRHLCYVAFDLLWASGWLGLKGDITGEPLIQRKTWLNLLVQQQPGTAAGRGVLHYFEVLTYKRVDANNLADRKKHIVEAFQEAINRGDEGIMIKLQESKYTAGLRSKEWLKLKPDCADGAHETLDVVIVGGYYGDGRRRAQGISHFLLAVFDPDTKKWVSFTKVGSGYAMDELRELQEYLAKEPAAGGPGWTVIDKSQRPVRLPGYLSPWVPKKDDVPDVMVKEPENSVVMEIQAASIAPTDSFATGYTTRFTRCRHIRMDKAAKDCITLREVVELAATNEGNLARAGDGTYGDAAKARRDARKAAVKKRPGSEKGGVVEQYAFQDLSDVQPSSNALHGLTVRVYNGPASAAELRKAVPELTEEEAKVYASKKGLEQLVHEMGGRAEANTLYQTHEMVEKPLRGLAGSKRRRGAAETVDVDDDAASVVTAATTSAHSRRLAKPRLLTDLCIAAAPVIEARNLHRDYDADVLTPAYLFACRAAGERVLPEPEHVLLASAATAARLAKVADAYGEHHTRLTTPEELGEVLRRVMAAQAAAGGGRDPVSRQPVPVVDLLAEWDDEDRRAFKRPYAEALGEPRWLGYEHALALAKGGAKGHPPD